MNRSLLVVFLLVACFAFESSSSDVSSSDSEEPFARVVPGIAETALGKKLKEHLEKHAQKVDHKIKNLKKHQRHVEKAIGRLTNRESKVTQKEKRAEAKKRSIIVNL